MTPGGPETRSMSTVLGVVPAIHPRYNGDLKRLAAVKLPSAEVWAN